MAGGMRNVLIFSDPPVIVRFADEHGVVEAGQACTVHVLPEGVIDVLLGTTTPENEPEPSSARGAWGIVVLLSNGVPLKKY